jgi:hypothetical protein
MNIKPLSIHIMYILYSTVSFKCIYYIVSVNSVLFIVILFYYIELPLKYNVYVYTF